MHEYTILKGSGIISVLQVRNRANFTLNKLAFSSFILKIRANRPIMKIDGKNII